MRFTPIAWTVPAARGGGASSGEPLPALLVEHNLPYDADKIMPRLMRDYAVGMRNVWGGEPAG
eukprot:270746-Chlamydomonas_euryale.AAC.5